MESSVNLQELVVEYLHYLHDLEIGAGYNFKMVRDDLRRRGRCDERTRSRLDKCIAEEAQHAAMIRTMLLSLGRPLNTINAIRSAEVRAFNAVAYLHRDLRPIARIYFNNLLERYFSTKGLDRFHGNLTRVAWLMGNTRLFDLVCDFQRIVASDEARHVLVGDDVLSIYDEALPGQSYLKAFKTLPIWQSPFVQVIRIRSAMERAIKALDQEMISTEVPGVETIGS